MPESEFDKHVQEELQGLRLRPSATVWENVEKELRRKRKRRVIIVFWLVAAIGLLGYSGYRLTQRSETTLATNATPAVHQPEQQLSANTSTPGTKQSPVQVDTNNDTSPITNDSSANTDKKTGEESATQAAADNNIATTGKEKNGTTGNTASRKHSSIKQKQTGSINKHRSPGNNLADAEGAVAKGNYKKQRGGKNQSKNGIVAGGDRADQPEQLKDRRTIVPENNNTAVAATTPASPVIDSSALKKDNAIALMENKDTVSEVKAPVVKKQGRSSKIKWSVDLAFGASGPIKSPFLLGTSADNLDAIYSAAPSNQGGIWTPVQPPGAFGPVYIPRSDIKPGPSARIGVLAELPVSKRSSFSTGLQYQYQSNNIRIGYYKDTSLVFNNYASQTVSVRAVYQGSQQKTFTNRYHYLQVPFNFHWQMNTSSKLPILLNTGLAAGYLITTNGLVYDSLQGGIYYHDKSAFTRFQLSFSTGVSFRFNNKGAFQWSVGPEFNMGLRRLVKGEYDKKQYPIFLGINARVHLPSRKK